MEGRVYYTRLLEKYIDGTSSAEETAELMEELARNADTEEWQTLLTRITENAAADLNYEPERWEEMIGNIVRTKEEAPVVEIRRRRSWIPYAAAAVVLIGIGAYLWNIQKDELHETTASSEARSAKEDVAPGGNKAVLTLADGSHIILDSAANGKIAQQGAAEIKKENGKIIYSPLPASAEASADKSIVDSRLSINTMTTPRGGQYQLSLPDGTQVWLNAESSITYPTAFTGNERRVSITGEAYFEVAKHRTKKFIVNVDNKQTVEVLGTHFNINAYKDENAIKTTLIEGLVKLTTHHSPLTLKPGQQAVLTIVDSPPSLKLRGTSRFSIVDSPDLDQVLAWKNGFFHLEDLTLEQAMRQFSRWYDIEIVYDKGIPNEKLSGEMDRFLTLRDALLGLEGVVAHFRLEGRTVHVTPL